MVEYEFTTITVRPATKERLDRVKVIDAESYDHLLNRLLDKLEAREAV